MEQKPIASAEVYFNPRSPHGERRDICGHMEGAQDFNPRSPHGERQSPENLCPSAQNISTHAPRTGSDSAK